jgi:hypothetical protein
VFLLRLLRCNQAVMQPPAAGCPDFPLGIGFVMNIDRQGRVSLIDECLWRGIVGEAQVATKPEQCR